MKNHWVQQRKLKIKPNITFGLFDGTNFVVFNCESEILSHTRADHMGVASSNDEFVNYFKTLSPTCTPYRLGMDAFISVHVDNVLIELHTISDVHLHQIYLSYMTGLRATNNLKIVASIVIESPQIANIKSSYFKT